MASHRTDRSRDVRSRRAGAGRDRRRRPGSVRRAVIRIIGAGMRSTVQDRGRFGHLRSGVPPAGAADPFALAAANALVGNAADAAGIEIIGTPFRFTCDDSRVIAVAGRDVSLATRARLPGWGSVFMRAGQQVTVHSGERTRYAYLAVSGGI